MPLPTALHKAYMSKVSYGGRLADQSHQAESRKGDRARLGEPPTALPPNVPCAAAVAEAKNRLGDSPLICKPPGRPRWANDVHELKVSEKLCSPFGNVRKSEV